MRGGMLSVTKAPTVDNIRQINVRNTNTRKDIEFIALKRDIFHRNHCFITLTD